MTLATNITDTDKGWKRIKSALLAAQNYGTAVGLPGNVGLAPTLAERAATQEYGSRDGKIPSRPFMRQAFDGNTKRIEQHMNNEIAAVIDGKYGPKQALSRVGEFFVGVIKSTIRRGDFKPLKPATILRKGSSRPLIDTGEMRNSITHKESKMEFGTV